MIFQESRMSDVRALTSMRIDTSCAARRGAGRLGRVLGVALVLTLAGCAGTGPFSPITDLNSSGGGGTYTVRPGDTLMSISRETGVGVEQLAAMNNISNPSLIRVGQRLRLGEGVAMPSGGSAAPGMDDSSAPVASNEPVTRAADAGKIDMIWPVKGEIIQRFTPQTKGIDIAGTVGDPIVAAATGKVVYAGNGVRGLGNLVILDHGDGFITAYAHNEKLMVKAGDNATKGSQVATLGQSDTTSPRLHFEVRRNGTPVDPLRYLPASQP